MEIYLLLSNINLVFEAIALCLGMLAFFTKKSDYNLKILLWFLFVTVLLEAFSTIAYYNKDTIGIDNVLGLYNIYDIVSFGLFFYLYDNLLNKFKTKLVVGFYLIYLFSVLIEATYSVNFGTENLIYSQILASLFLSIIVFLYFTDILKEGNAGSLFNNIFFWLSIGLLLYHIGQIPFRVVTNFFTFQDTISFLFFNLRTILRIIMFILIAIGVYRHLRHS